MCRSSIKYPIFTPPPGTSASPGFTWARFGDASAGTYLQNDGVPSNIAGRKVPFSGVITRIFVTSENNDTFDVSIMRRTGVNTFTTVTTVSLSSERARTFSGLSAAVVTDDELSAQISGGSCRNVEIGVVIEQT